MLQGSQGEGDVQRSRINYDDRPRFLQVNRQAKEGRSRKLCRNGNDVREAGEAARRRGAWETTM